MIHIVELSRADHNWPRGYFDALIGLSIRMPAVIDNGRVLTGVLLDSDESDDEVIRLKFADFQPEA